VQRYNKFGETEEIRLILLDELHRITSESECAACNVSRCFYHLHHRELTEGYLSDCSRLTGKQTTKVVLVPEKPSKATRYDTQSRIDMSMVLKEPDMPDSEERRRLLKILFAKGGAED